MKSRFLSTLAPIALAASLSFAVPAAFAKSPAEWQAIASKATVSLDQAIAKAAEAGKGTVIDIELDDGDGAGPPQADDHHVLLLFGARHGQALSPLIDTGPSG